MAQTGSDIPLLKKIVLTVRAFSYTASVTPVLLGTALAAYSGHTVRWGLFAVTLVGVLLFHTAANLLNDCFDHRRGLDTIVRPVSGGVVRGWYSERQVLRAALVLLTLGILIGIFLVWICRLVILAAGAVGAAIAVGYTRSGFCLKYAGIGDFAIMLAFGLLPVFGSYWVQAESFSWLPLLWSIPLALPTVGILHANNWRDIESDQARGCRSVAAILGRSGSLVYYRGLVIGPFVLTATYLVVALAGGVASFAPPAVALVALAIPAAVKLLRLSRGSRDVMAVLDASTARLQLMYGLLLPGAFVLAAVLPWGS